MRRVIGHGVKALVTGALLFVLTPSCADNDVSIFIQNVMAPPQNRQQGCVYTPQGGGQQVVLSQGTVDFTGRDTYTAALLVGNQMTPRGDSTNVRAETNRARINGVTVRVTSTSNELLGEFSSAGAGFVDPGTQTQASLGVVIVDIIDARTMQRIASRLGPANRSTIVLANVRAFGQTLGGVDLESGEFQFPIRVCFRCLVNFDSGDDPNAEGRDCTLPLPALGGPGDLLPCFPAQDEDTPCQTCSREFPGCRGAVAGE